MSIFFSAVGYSFDGSGDHVHSLFRLALAVNILGHVDIRVTQNVSHTLRLAPRRIWPECMVRKFRKYPLPLGSVE